MHLFRFRPTLQSAIALSQCIALTVFCCAPAHAARAKKHPGAAPAAKIVELQGDDRILHALNRLTWGPRPGDLDAVRSMGLQNWINQQLNPSTLDDTAADQLMQRFPALALSPSQMVLRFPDNNLAKQVADGKMRMPNDPYLNAVYRNAIARYQRQQEKKQSNTAQNTESMMAMNNAAPQTSNPQLNAMAAEAMQSQPAPRRTMQNPPLTAANGASPDMKSNEARMYADLEATEILNLQPEQRIVRLIEMQPQEMVDFRNRLSPQERAELARGLSPQQREIVASLENPGVVVASELAQAKLLHSIETNRQLEDVMVDFWLNHFNIYIKKGQPEPYYIEQYEKDVLRPNALGKFEDLLEATAHSPAMLFYLDNWTSVGPNSQAVARAKKAAAFSGNPQAIKNADRGLNENYGRELMELHTLGVDGGYTQQDVTQVARVFTGWTIDKPQLGGGFQFDANRHEPGPKEVLGKTINEAGEAEGKEVLHMLATSPATAHHVSFEIAQRFVADAPPESLVKKMADAWLASDGDIRTVLRTMINAPEFWSKDVYRAKVKTPIEFVISAARAGNANITTAVPLAIAMDRLDMPLFGEQPPTGYPITADHWVSTSALLNRMNFALYFASGRMPGIAVDWNSVIATASLPPQEAELQKPNGVNGGKSAPPATSVAYDVAEWQPSDKELDLEKILLGAPASHQIHDTILQQMLNQPNADPNALERQFAVRRNPSQPDALVGSVGIIADPKAPTADQRQMSTIAGLLIGSPEFQRR